jgi:hypothetical protein
MSQVFGGDDSCGPSSALQSLGKHVNGQSAAQNERLHNHQGPRTNGFRTPLPQGSNLNESFHAFTSGAPASGLSFDVDVARITPGPAEWSSEFAKLSIDRPGSGFQQHQHSQHFQQPQHFQQSQHFQQPPPQNHQYPQGSKQSQPQPSQGWSNDFLGSLAAPIRPSSQPYSISPNYVSGPSSIVPQNRFQPLNAPGVGEATKDQKLTESFEKAFQQVEQYIASEADVSKQSKGKEPLIDQTRMKEIVIDDYNSAEEVLQKPSGTNMSNGDYQKSVNKPLQTLSEPIEILEPPIEAIPEYIRPESTDRSIASDLQRQEDQPNPLNATEDLSGVARDIVEAVNGSGFKDKNVSDKLKNSAFMNLMEKLSTKQVILQDEKFLDTNGNDVGTNDMLKQTDSQGTTTPDIEAVYETIRNNLNLNGEQDQQHGRIMTPLEMAQQVMPGLSAAAWEENWDEYM